MAQPKVAIRLGTEGKSEVQRDFADIGNAGDAAANRAARSFDKASQDIESAVRRQAAAADKLRALTGSAFLSQPTQATIDARMGGGPSAMDMGATFTALIAQQEQYEQRAIAIRAALDPLWAAQQRYNVELNEARTLHAAGALSAELLAQKELQLKAALDAVSVSHTSGSASAGQYKAGVQQLGFQVQDLGVQMAMAAGSGNVVKGVMTGLAMQGPQIVSAIALMRGAAGGFIGFLAGPWGAALMAATSVLAVLGSQFLSTGDKAEKSAGQVDRYTAALRRLASIQGQVAAQDLADAKIRSEQIRGQISRLDQQIASSQGTRASLQRRNELQSQRDALVGELSNAEATAAGAQMAWDNRLKLNAMNAQDKIDSKASREAAAAARRAEREREREKERQNREWQRFLLNTEQGINNWAYDYPVGQSATDSLTKQGEDLQRINDLMREQRAEISGGTALLNLEWQLRGRGRKEVEDTLALERYRLEITRQFTPEQLATNVALQQHIQDQMEAQRGQIEMNRLLEDYARDWQEMKDFGEGFIDRVLSPDAWSSWGNLGKTVLREIQNEMMKLALINPLKNLLFKEGLPTLGSVFGLLGGGSSSAAIPSLAPIGTYNSAIGNEYTPAGAMLVGENGPEIVDMPRGARVMNAGDTRRAMDAASAPAPTIVNVYANDAFVRETIIGWIREGMDIAAVNGAVGGMQMGQAESAAAGSRRLGRSWG